VEFTVAKYSGSSNLETVSVTASLEREALALPAKERVKSAERILNSVDSFVDDELKTAWDRELTKRSAEICNGEVEGMDSDAAFAEARRLLDE